MNRRVFVAVLVLFVLITMAGCIGPFADDGLTDEDLDAPANYTWDSPYDGDIDVDTSAYHAVYHLDGTDTFELSRRGYYRQSPRDVEAVRYRFPNGTMLTGSEIDIEQSSTATTITVPDGNGTLAFRGAASSRQVTIPALVEGSYRVTLPEDRRVQNFFISDVSPSNDESTIVDGRQILTWDDNSDTIRVQYHHWRDHYLFYGFLGMLGVITLIGLAYYRRELRRIARKREQTGLDIDDRDPPR